MKNTGIQNMHALSFAKATTIATFLLSFQISHAQSDQLLEACNSIEDKSKRLSCLRQLNNLQNNTASKDSSNLAQDAAIARAKGVFYSTASAVKSGLSYNSYTQLILEPAKEIGMLRSTSPTLDSYFIEKLEESVTAYNDAATIWHAGIFKRQDGGIFYGKILNPERENLTPIVRKYQLFTTTVLLTPHLPYEQALASIWKRADDSTKEAFDFIEYSRSKGAKVEVNEKEIGKTPQTTKIFEPHKDDESIVERLAKESGCNTHPVAAHTGTIAGKREYAVYCSKGNTVYFTCQNQECK